MNKIAPAFIKAKQAFGPVLKDKSNPAFKSKYADLSACLEAVDSACLSAGIAMYQETFEDAKGVTVETVFLHESGESLRCGKLHVPAAKQDPQGFGSALTYARRYSVLTACGLAPEDDDGNAAVRAAQAERLRARSAWLSEWLAEIDDAASMGVLKNVMTTCIAEARHENDADAEGQFLAAQATKIAKAKKAQEQPA